MNILRVLLHAPCVFHLLTGLYCPGCGGTRAVRYLLKGQLGNSVQYHPLVLYMVVIMLAEFAIAGLARVTGKPKWHPGHEKLLIAIAIGIVLVNWCWKNYMLVVYGIDLLPNSTFPA